MNHCDERRAKNIFTVIFNKKYPLKITLVVENNVSVCLGIRFLINIFGAKLMVSRGIVGVESRK